MRLIQIKMKTIKAMKIIGIRRPSRGGQECRMGKTRETNAGERTGKGMMAVAGWEKLGAC
jgi:hypothetical protein